MVGSRGPFTEYLGQHILRGSGSIYHTGVFIVYCAVYGPNLMDHSVLKDSPFPGLLLADPVPGWPARAPVSAPGPVTAPKPVGWGGGSLMNQKTEAPAFETQALAFVNSMMAFSAERHAQQTYMSKKVIWAECAQVRNRKGIRGNQRGRGLVV